MVITKSILLIITIGILLWPLVWMFSGSTMDIQGIYVMPPRLFYKPSLDNYKILLKNLPLLIWAVNTILQTIMTVTVSIAITAMAGYAISIYRFKGRELIWWLFLASLMVPRQVMIIPMYVICRVLGVSGSRIGAMLPLLFSAFHILLFRVFVDHLPKGLIDSARLDGCTEIGVILRIAAPLCKPIIAALALFRCFEVMGDFLWQNLILQDVGKKTLLVGLLQATQQRGGNAMANINPLGLRMAAGVILFLPLLVIFIFASRYFVSGILAGGIKE